MTKVFFILAAIVTAVAAVFAWQLKNEFTETRNQVIALNKNVETELAAVTAVVAQVTKINGDIAAVQQELDVENEKIKAQKLKIAQTDNDAKRAQDELDAKNKQLAELTEKLSKLPKGVKPETLVEDINNMKKAIAEFQAEAEMKKKEIAGEETKVDDLRRALDEINRKIEDRKRSFDRNSLNAQVVAVNSDWGFVVVNAGQSLGITEATKLLVTRGTQTIGKLSIVSVQGERTVANILSDTLAQGVAIAPGDRVILENLYQ